jgi:hypothetical protein
MFYVSFIIFLQFNICFIGLKLFIEHTIFVQATLDARSTTQLSLKTPLPLINGFTCFKRFYDWCCRTRLL